MSRGYDMCDFPNHGFKIGFWPKTGKPRYLVTSSRVKWISMDSKGHWVRHEDGIPYGDYVDDPVLLKCGQCTQCRLDYAKDWAIRCMLEAQYHDNSYFITLTYNDDSLSFLDEESGEMYVPEFPSLQPRDLELFWKRLRKNSGQQFRYYACGEYGSKGFRPHYHAIVFGITFYDLYLWEANYRGDPIFRSPLLEKCWKYGFSSVAECNWDTCSYVARYMLKKIKGKGSSVYEEIGVYPPFTRCSNKPGIGRAYYDDNKDRIYEYDRLNLATHKGGLSLKPPSYYDKIYDIDYPKEMERIKENRRSAAVAAEAAKSLHTDLAPADLRRLHDDNLNNRLGHVKERSNLL